MDKYIITYWWGTQVDSALISANDPEEAAEKLINHFKRVSREDIINIRKDVR